MKSKATPSHPNNIIMYEKRKATHDIITYSYFVCIKKVNILRMQCNHNKSELHPPTFTREIHFTQKYFFFSLSISRKSTDDQEYHSDQKKNPTTFDYHTTDRTKTEQARERERESEQRRKKNIRNQNNDRIEYKYWYSLTLLLVFCVFFLFLLPNVFWLLFFYCFYYLFFVCGGATTNPKDTIRDARLKKQKQS